MITVGNAIISEDIADKFFVCDLGKCKGACCVEGDQGAPLLQEELQVLSDAAIWGDPESRLVLRLIANDDPHVLRQLD